MPNEEQEQEGEASGGDSGEWHSNGGGEEESKDSSSGEEVDSPPHTERRSKQRQDPTSVRGKATPPTGQASKRTRTCSPVPSKKALKHPKLAPSKPRKALPKIKVVVPSLLGNYCVRPLSFCMTRSLVDSLSCFNRVNSEICSAASRSSIFQDDDDEEMEDTVTSNAGITLVILSLLYHPF